MTVLHIFNVGQRFPKVSGHLSICLIKMCQCHISQDMKKNSQCLRACVFVLVKLAERGSVGGASWKFLTTIWRLEQFLDLFTVFPFIYK